jgi:hypothetical protein
MTLGQLMRSLHIKLASSLGTLSLLAAATALAEPPVRGTVDIGGTPALVELRLGKTAGELRIRPAGRSAGWERLPLTYPRDVLPLLADARLAFLWAPLETWAGDDLARMRDRTLASTRTAWETGSASARPSTAAEGSTRRPVRALLQYVEALGQAGRLSEARSLLEAQRARMPFKSDWDRVEWGMVSQTLAAVQSLTGDRAAAIHTLAETSQRLADTPYRLNALISQASELAEDGRHAEALELVDGTRAAFLATQKPGEPVPGALLQFDWVRACALHGLGRTAEAATLVQGIAAAEQPTHKRLMPPPNLDLQVRAYSCSHDAAALAALWTQDLAAPAIGSSTFIAAQPAFRDTALHAETVKRARASFAPASPIRILPDRYAAALRQWQ